MKKKQVLHLLCTFCILSLFIASCNSDDKGQINANEMTNSNSDEASHSIEIDTIDHDFEFMPPSQFKLLPF